MVMRSGTPGSQAHNISFPPFRNCTPLVDYFQEKNGSTCLVFPLLGSSVYDFLQGNNGSPFPRKHVQKFGKQLLSALACELCFNLVYQSVIQTLKCAQKPIYYRHSFNWYCPLRPKVRQPSLEEQQLLRITLQEREWFQFH